MQHRIMTGEQLAHYDDTGCCPACLHERLKRGVNLKDGWLLCTLCEVWWQAPRR